MNDNGKRLICFTGAGGTGKTTMLELLKAAMPEAVVHGSIVRQFYAERGVVHEGDFLLRPDKFRKDFQLALYETYFNKLKEAWDSSGECDVICDRAIYDHYAYTLYGCRGMLKASDIAGLDELRRAFEALMPIVYYFPYPTPWDDNAADGFRDRSLDKDYIINALIHWNLTRCTTPYYRLPHTSPPTRLHSILASLRR